MISIRGLIMRLFILFCILPVFCQAIEFKQGWSMEFVGSLDGKKDIRLLLYRSKSDKIWGSYYSTKELKRYEVRGNISGNKISFSEKDGEKEIASFQGIYKDEKKPTLNGTYTSGDLTKETSLSYHIQFPAVPGKNLYDPICADSTEAVETFCTKLKKDILSGNKEEIAPLIYLPMHTHIDGKEVKITTQEEFKNNFDKIFYPEFKQAIKNNCIPMNMCNSYKGVWFGFNKELVIQMISQKDGEPFRLKVAEIHNKPKK